MDWFTAQNLQQMLFEPASFWCSHHPFSKNSVLKLPRFKNVLGLNASSEALSAILCGEQQHINPNIKQTNQPRKFFKRKASTTANHAKAWDAKLRPTKYARPSQTCRKAGTQNHGSFLFGSRILGFAQEVLFFAQIRTLIETKNNRSVVECKDSRVTVGELNGGRVTRCTSLGGAFS